MPADPSGQEDGAGNPDLVSRQATVSEFDPDSGAGAVLHDDGHREEFPGHAFHAGGLRLLRSGQRVRLDYAGRVVRKVTLITLP